MYKQSRQDHAENANVPLWSSVLYCSDSRQSDELIRVVWRDKDDAGLLWIAEFIAGDSHHRSTSLWTEQWPHTADRGCVCLDYKTQYWEWQNWHCRQLQLWISSHSSAQRPPNNGHLKSMWTNYVFYTQKLATVWYKLCEILTVLQLIITTL